MNRILRWGPPVRRNLWTSVHEHPRVAYVVHQAPHLFYYSVIASGWHSAHTIAAVVLIVVLVGGAFARSDR